MDKWCNIYIHCSYPPGTERRLAGKRRKCLREIPRWLCLKIGMLYPHFYYTVFHFWINTTWISITPRFCWYGYRWVRPHRIRTHPETAMAPRISPQQVHLGDPKNEGQQRFQYHKDWPQPILTDIETQTNKNKNVFLLKKSIVTPKKVEN